MPYGKCEVVGMVEVEFQGGSSVRSYNFGDSAVEL